MKTFINHFKSISRFTFQEGKIIENPGITEPEYETILDPRTMRRMSKILKMGLYTSMSVLENNSGTIDGIICGTALGCTSDTYSFLKNMIERNEQLLTPTPFIQSTHNTLAGTLGILLKNHGYNITWSNRNFSFFDAFEDSILQLERGNGSSFLLTTADEMPDIVNEIINHIKLEIPVKLQGEGSVSFTLSSSICPTSIEVIDYKVISTEHIDDYLKDLNEEAHIINTHPTFRLKPAANHHNILTLARSMIDDAFGLEAGCHMTEYLDGKFGRRPLILCLSGDCYQASVITIKKV